MRADFWGECAPYERLRTLMQAHQELIPPMTATELRRVIEPQAKAVGLRFEADLGATILEDVQGEPGAMPRSRLRCASRGDAVADGGCAARSTGPSAGSRRPSPTPPRTSTSGCRSGSGSGPRDLPPPHACG